MLYINSKIILDELYLNSWITVGRPSSPFIYPINKSCSGIWKILIYNQNFDIFRLYYLQCIDSNNIYEYRLMDQIDKIELKFKRFNDAINLLYKIMKSDEDFYEIRNKKTIYKDNNRKY